MEPAVSSRTTRSSQSSPLTKSTNPTPGPSGTNTGKSVKPITKVTKAVISSKGKASSPRPIASTSNATSNNSEAKYDAEVPPEKSSRSRPRMKNVRSAHRTTSDVEQASTSITESSTGTGTSIISECDFPLPYNYNYDFKLESYKSCIIRDQIYHGYPLRSDLAFHAVFLNIAYADLLHSDRCKIEFLPFFMPFNTL